MRVSDDPEGSPSTLPQLLQLATRLEQAWRATPKGRKIPELRAFLPPPADPLRPAALRELVRVDLAMRWQHGQPAFLESYVQQFPELGDLAALPAELIYHEYRVRQQHGDRPNLALYQERFPAQYPRLLLLARGEAAPPDASELETSALDWATHTPEAESGNRGGEILLPSSTSLSPPPGSPPVVPMVGGYRMISRLGAGALGEVWKAEAPGGVEVAVKRLSRTLEAHEAQYELQSLEHVKRLRHNFLVQIHAFWVHESRLYVVMEMADGSLDDRKKELRKQGLAAFPRDELLRYMREAAEALDYLHAQGVHHRDIKPANILLMGGHVKVADFGLARPLKAEQSLVNATFCGTPAYMAPEVWDSKFSSHSDQWSLVVTYLELRLNRRVFKSNTIPALMSEIRKGQMDLAPLEKAERRVIRKALQHNPRQRYPSCSAFVQALDALDHPPPPPPPPPRRRLLAVLSLLACLVAGGLLAALVHRLGDSPVPVPRPARVHLTVPPGEKAVNTGGEVSFQIAVQRDNYEGPIQLLPEEELAHVTVEAIGYEKEEFVNVTVHVDREAKPGRLRVHLRGDSEILEKNPFFDLTIRYLPKDFQPVGPELETDDTGVTYYKRIRRPLGEIAPVEFVLIPQKNEAWQTHANKSDPPTYYISRFKIARGQFRFFADLNPKVERYPQRELDNRWKNHADEEGMPVRDVTVTDADAFAAWLGGRLPSRVQWDKAAGYYHPKRGQAKYWEGSYKGRWKDKPQPLVAVGIADDLPPLPIGSPKTKDDESIYHSRDMAGNGSEWTREMLGKEQPVPLKESLGNERVFLRGWRFTDLEPLTFSQLDDENKGAYRTWLYTDVDAELGFRMVLEPNGSRSR